MREEKAALMLLNDLEKISELGYQISMIINFKKRMVIILYESKV